jgi:hypothetical protein
MLTPAAEGVTNESKSPENWAGEVTGGFQAY